MSSRVARDLGKRLIGLMDTLYGENTPADQNHAADEIDRALAPERQRVRRLVEAARGLLEFQLDETFDAKGTYTRRKSAELEAIKVQVRAVLAEFEFGGEDETRVGAGVERAWVPKHWRETLNAPQVQSIVGVTKHPDDAEHWVEVEIREAAAVADFEEER